MAKVPSLPSTGQPIDTQYIYDIVDALIKINAELVTYGSSNINVLKAKAFKKTSNVNIDAQQVNIINATTVTKGVPQTGQIAFLTTFTTAPVVTATLVAKNNSKVNAKITITNVDTKGVYYKLDFDDTGQTTLDVNIIAIGA